LEALAFVGGVDEAEPLAADAVAGARAAAALVADRVACSGVPHAVDAIPR
jgi:hypothetical protein